MKTITRYAPSPTGFLHVGHARAAIMNWLYARKNNGEFILRIDDTDLERTKKEYIDSLKIDLKWLGLDWDKTFTQSSRMQRYSDIKEQLLKSGRLYQCFETEEELGYKRKLQLSSGKPPIYDRTALKLSQDQINNYLNSGRKPHYRFLLDDKVVSWKDMIKDEVKYDCTNLSDPVIIRENGSMTYMLCSVIDDVDYSITNIIRGEDHLTNTAVQIQMFEALKAKPPSFAHFSLVKVKDEKISKRVGGFEIKSLRDNLGLEPMAVNSFFSFIGTSNPVAPFKNLKELAEVFDITSFSKSPTTYSEEDLIRLNHKLIISLEFVDVKDKLNSKIDEKFWYAVRPNLQKLSEVNDWWKICSIPPNRNELDKEFLTIATQNLPEEITEKSCSNWIAKISQITGKKGKELFHPLRLALTGSISGPELKNILMLLPREEILKRLQ